MLRDTAPHTTSRPRPRLPLLCIFFALLTQAHSLPTTFPSSSTNQFYVVCKNLDSNTCVTWLFDATNEKEVSNELTPFNRPSEICGLSDLEPIPPHRKFISVKPFESSKYSTVFCKTLKVVTEDAYQLTDFTVPFTSLYRERRQTAYGLRGRYRGQTQSQYLAIDGGNGKDEGKAEAHSAADSSRASVSGNSGMGQAQSQTIYDPSCEECYGGRSDMDVSNLRRPQHDIYGNGRGSPRPSEVGAPGQGGQGIPDRNGIGGHIPPSQIGGQGIPGQGGIAGQELPGQGGTNGLGRPGQGGNNGQGLPGLGGMHGQGIPGQGGITNQVIPGQGGINGQGRPGQGGIGSQGIPGQGDINGQGRPGQGGIGGQGIPGQGGIGGQGIPGQGGINGQGRPGQGGIGGHGIPGQGDINGQGRPGQGVIGGQGIPGQGGIGGQGIPGQGGINGQGRPGQGGIGGHGIPGQGGINGQGRPGQGGIGGQGIPGQSGINVQGRPGQGGIGGQGIPEQGGINGQGRPGQGGIGGQGIPGQVGINGQGRPGQGGIGGQGIPGPGSINGQGRPGQGGIGGQGIPGQVGINGQGRPEQGGIGVQGLPGLGSINGQGRPGQGGIGGQGIPGQGGINGQARPGQGGIGGQGIPGQGDINGQGRPEQGGIGGQGMPGQGGINGQPTGMVYPPYDTSIIQGGKWPFSSGPIRGADGLLYYCCVVNPNQGSYPNQVAGGIQQTPGGSHGHTNGAPQITGSGGQQPQYGNGGIGHPGYTYSSGGTGQTRPGEIYGQAINSARQQPNYGNAQPGPSYNYGASMDGQPDLYRQTGSAPSTGNTLQYGSGGTGNGQQGHPYTYGPGVDIQSNQNKQQGPNYTYGPGRNIPTSPGVSYEGSQVPTDNAQPTVHGNSQYGPDYTYGSGGPGHPVNTAGIYGQTGGSQYPYGAEQHTPAVAGQQTIYNQGGNVQQPIPGYNYGSDGSGQPNLDGAYGQNSQPYGGTEAQPQYGPGGNGQLSPTYTYDGNGQPNVGETYGQKGGLDTSRGPGHQNTYGREGNGQQTPSYTYDQGTGQPTHGGTYEQSGVQPQSTYPHGTNGLKGPDSSYGSEGANPTGSYGLSGGGPSTTGNIGTQNSYSNGGNVQQGNDYNNPDYDGNNQGQQNVNGYEQSQGSGQKTNYGEPQNVMDPNSIIEEDDDSQALASVYQGLNGTTASASSQGGNEKGRAQTNVQGTYTDAGSFSAQASISDENKGAESQVSGSKKGATSNAAGRARRNKSQAAVKLGSETGSIQTESQSRGNMHSSNTQVQGSVKGGVADAQARGPGSTSSQAQIGFTPYKDGDKTHEVMKTPFEGGGTASAQSSGRMGTSQSQLRGTFKYGITYNGAAQAGASLDKDAVFSNFTQFDKIDVFDQNNTNINVNVENTDKPLNIDLPPDSSTSYEGLEQNENTIQDSNISYNGHSHYDHHKPKEEVNTTNILPLQSNRRAFSSPYDNNNGGDYDYNVDDTPTDEYDVEEVPEGVDNIPNEYTNYDNYGRENENTHQSQRQVSTSRKGLEVRQSTGGSTQHILIGSLKNQDAKITQIKSERPDESKVYQPGERVPGMGGYTIPAGFTGSVKSVSSKEKTFVVGTKQSPSQAQTVTLTPGSGKVKYTYPEHYGRNNIQPKNLRSLYNPRPDDNRYVSVSKSVTRDLDSENNIRKQYSHTYYTKSSSCGYFTFTCTMVSSAEGKKKVCRPKIPTNPDGTPMRC